MSDKLQTWIDIFGTNKIIVRSNEDESLKIGKFIGFDKTISSLKNIPMILCNNEKFYCMGVMIPWTEEMEIFLKSLSNKRQWEVLSALSMAIQILH